MISKPTARLATSPGAQGRVLRVRHLWRIIAALALALWPLAVEEPAPVMAQPGVTPGWQEMAPNQWVYASEERTAILSPANTPIPFTFTVPIPSGTCIGQCMWAYGIWVTGNSPWGDVGFRGSWRPLNRILVGGNSSGYISARSGGQTEVNVSDPTPSAICHQYIPGQDSQCGFDLYYDPAGYQVTVRFYLYLEMAVATPTPTPQPQATPFPVAQACIPASQVAGPTPTLPARTPTPYGTRTPTATPTPGTPAPTATPVVPGINVINRFDTALSPWNITTGSTSPVWSADPGPNGSPGIAFVPFNGASLPRTEGDTTPNIPAGALAYIPGTQIATPFRIVADVQVPDAPLGYYYYLRMFYRRGADNVWVLAGVTRVNVAWHTITVSASPTISVTAVALHASYALMPIESNFFIPGDSTDGVQIDNLRLTAGPASNDPLAVGLPICAGSGGAQTPTPPQTKVCYITVVQTDVYEVCKAPETILEVGLWVNWLVCRVQRYFSFLKENRAQLDTINNRQRENQPIGPLLEVPTVVDTGYQIVADIGRVNAATDYRSVDWSTFVNWQVFNADPFLISAPDPNALDQEQFACDLGITNVPPNMYRGACFAINTVRAKTPLLPLLQWVLDIGMLLGVIIYFKNTWMSRNE